MIMAFTMTIIQIFQETSDSNYNAYDLEKCVYEFFSIIDDTMLLHIFDQRNRLKQVKEEQK